MAEPGPDQVTGVIPVPEEPGKSSTGGVSMVIGGDPANVDEVKISPALFINEGLPSGNAMERAPGAGLGSNTLAVVAVARYERFCCCRTSGRLLLSRPRDRIRQAGGGLKQLPVDEFNTAAGAAEHEVFAIVRAINFGHIVSSPALSGSVNARPAIWLLAMEYWSVRLLTASPESISRSL